jgi:hypothetical protein
MYIDDSSISSQEIARLGTDTTGGSATDLVASITFNSRHHGSTVSNGTSILGKMNGTLKWTIDGVVYNYTYTVEKYTPSNAES